MTVRVLTVVGVAVAECAAMSAATAGATPPDGDAARTDIANGTTETPASITTDGPTTLIVQGLVLSPGASSGWHTHPGTELSVITGGSGQAVLTYTLPVDAPAREDAPDVCAH